MRDRLGILISRDFRAAILVTLLDIKTKGEPLIHLAGRLTRTDLQKAREKSEQKESQLTMLLGISLTSTWLHTCPRTRFSPNGLQGKLDQSLADVFAETAESCWLLELKRDYRLIDKEREKTARQNQFSRLKSDAEMHRIADRCHWIAWGVEEQAGVPNLQFARYWNAFEFPNSVRVEMTLEEFSKHAFLSRARGSIAFRL